MKKYGPYFIILIFFYGLNAKELQWNWNSINTNNIFFPKNFYWGASDSSLQTEGMESVDGLMIENCWTELEKKILPKNSWVGKACERWSRYKEDVQLIKECNFSMHRFSIAWSKIEPEKGKFNEKALDHYEAMVDEMRSQGIEPMISLFHHTYPIWFGQLGSFENYSNVYYLWRYAKFIFQRLHKKVKYWVVMNEPVAFAIEAYWRGNYPPAKKSLKLAGKVAKNMLDMQVFISRELKKIDSKALMGLAHVMNLLEPYRPWNPLEIVGAKFFDYLVNDLTIDYFRTGKFNWAFMVRDKNKNAPGSLDFIGINYYTHTTIKQTGIFNMAPIQRSEEIPLTEPIDDGRGYKVMYPEGIYRCIRRASKLKIPMFITENGSSTSDPRLTEEYMRKHLYAISKAIKEGYDVRGYLFWTLMDCFGWKKAYSPKHGIYEVDFKTQKRTLRPAFNFLLTAAKKFSVRSG